MWSGNKRSCYLSDPDLFNAGLGKLAGQIHLETDPLVSRVKLLLHKVPLAAKDELARELTCLENVGVIVRKEYPTEWVSSLVVARKASGEVRVSIDPKLLNKA